MARSRRRFLRQGGVTGAALGMLGLSQVEGEDGNGQDAIPTARAKMLMALFGLRYPIFAGPFGGIDLASAVSNSGAMGTIPLWTRTPEEAYQDVAQMRRQTKQPFVVNYVMAREPISLPRALEAGAPVVGFSWGLPSKQVVSMIRASGAKFGVQVGTAAGARAALDLGADYLICQGTEAGGHVQSSTPLYELLPGVLSEAKETPVLAGGGIGNGQKIRKALLGGASGTLLGTRFVATQESYAHTEYKNAIVRAHAQDTAMSVCFQDAWPGATHRTIRNTTLNRWEAAGCPPIGKRPGEGDIVATGPGGRKVVRYQGAIPLRGMEGTVTDLAMYAGQSVEDVKDLPSARDLVARLWAECLAARRV